MLHRKVCDKTEKAEPDLLPKNQVLSGNKMPCTFSQEEEAAFGFL